MHDQTPATSLASNLLLFQCSTLLLVIGPIKQRSPTFLALGAGFVEDNFSMGGGWGGDGSGCNASDGSGSNASDGEQAADEASLTCPLLTSCSVTRFLTGFFTSCCVTGTVGLGDPCYKGTLLLLGEVFCYLSINFLKKVFPSHIVNSFLG